MGVLRNPSQSLEWVRKSSLESYLVEYLRLLTITGIAAGIASIVLDIGKVVYLNIFSDVEIQYWRMLNYALGNATSMVFFALFFGTFVFFVLSLIVAPFVRHIKYADVVKLLAYSLTPVLLFGWIVLLIPGLLVWSLFIFSNASRNYKKKSAVKRGTIEERE